MSVVVRCCVCETRGSTTSIKQRAECLAVCRSAAPPLCRWKWVTSQARMLSSNQDYSTAEAQVARAARPAALERSAGPRSRCALRHRGREGERRRRTAVVRGGDADAGGVEARHDADGGARLYKEHSPQLGCARIRGRTRRIRECARSPCARMAPRRRLTAGWGASARMCCAPLDASGLMRMVCRRRSSARTRWRRARSSSPAPGPTAVPPLPPFAPGQDSTWTLDPV
jgi:hypothetical protein